MKFKQLKDMLMQQVKAGKKVYVKIVIVPYSAKPHPIYVDFAQSHKHFDEFGLVNKTGNEKERNLFKLKHGATFRIKPVRMMDVVGFEISE